MAGLQLTAVNLLYHGKVGRSPGAAGGEIQISITGVPVRSGFQIGGKMIDSAGKMSAALDHGLIHDDHVQTGLAGCNGRIQAGGATADDQYISL